MEEGYLILTMGNPRALLRLPVPQIAILRGGKAVAAPAGMRGERGLRYEPAESIEGRSSGGTGIAPTRDLPRPCRLGGSPAAHAAADCPSPAPSGAHAGVTILDDGDLDGGRALVALLHLEGDLVALDLSFMLVT